jgi:hypothetical protein
MFSHVKQKRETMYDESMLYCDGKEIRIVLYCIVLYSTILYCNILYCMYAACDETIFYMRCKLDILYFSTLLQVRGSELFLKFESFDGKSIVTKVRM